MDNKEAIEILECLAGHLNEDALFKDRSKAIDHAIEVMKVSEWQPIEEYNGEDLVYFANIHNPRNQAVGFKMGNDYLVLNHNEHPDGSEVILWQPTHWKPAQPPKEGE
ncbi:MAG: hypothetical protein ABFD79_05335 [Phycisphaerales bacterium]